MADMTGNVNSAKPLYTLNHTNEVETNRLDSNHYNLYLPMQGGHAVPPHIKAYLASVKGGAKVIDVGTGTGCFLTTLAEQVPSIKQLDGFDPDTSKFPPADSLPKNVRLMGGDATQPFPEEMNMAGSYDLVHARLQFFSWRKDEWPRVVQAMVALLKPGGHLLWHEGGWHGWQTIPPSLAFDEYLGHEIKRTMALGREPLPAFKLPGWFKDAGLRDINKEVFNVLQDEKIQRLGADVLYTVCYQSALGVADQGDTPGLATRERVHELFRQIKLDFDAGLVGQEFRWVWGRKPHVGESVDGPPTPAASSTYAVSARTGSNKGGDEASATPRTHKRKSSLFAWVKDALALTGSAREKEGKTAAEPEAAAEPAKAEPAKAEQPAAATTA
ncbi:uncharacterized protein PG986_004999 [Apiospora aurea]|uniref:S-adenosyl-L-methionine-dependent methyltransferase n=1 Tax=Apiospora aurea TaxID=335848 RepID=A0ABR1QGA7_9PEZI